MIRVQYGKYTDGYNSAYLRNLHLNIQHKNTKTKK